MLLLPGQQTYRQGMVCFDGIEEWSFSRGLLDFSDSRSCVPLVWDEDDPIPLKCCCCTEALLKTGTDTSCTTAVSVQGPRG